VLKVISYQADIKERLAVLHGGSISKQKGLNTFSFGGAESGRFSTEAFRKSLTLRI
jgi:hypothetical protein